MMTTGTPVPSLSIPVGTVNPLQAGLAKVGSVGGSLGSVGSVSVAVSGNGSSSSASAGAGSSSPMAGGFKSMGSLRGHIFGSSFGGGMLGGTNIFPTAGTGQDGSPRAANVGMVNPIINPMQVRAVLVLLHAIQQATISRCVQLAGARSSLPSYAAMPQAPQHIMQGMGIGSGMGMHPHQQQHMMGTPYIGTPASAAGMTPGTLSRHGTGLGGHTTPTPYTPRHGGSYPYGTSVQF